MPIDTALMGALHVEYLRERDLGGDEHLHHTLFQTSTVDALLEGKYEGDVSFAELGDRGDFGLGTFDALDGEMICLDGTFFQVKADGRAYAVDGQARTPFAVVTLFEPDTFQMLPMPMDFEDLCDYVDGSYRWRNRVRRCPGGWTFRVCQDAQRAPPTQALSTPRRGRKGPAHLRASRCPRVASSASGSPITRRV